MPERHFRLLDHLGLDSEGNPEPIHEVGLAVAIPTIRGGEIVDIEERVTVKAAPGTRVIKTDDPLVAGALLGSGQFEEIDPPSSAQLKKERKQTQDAREGATTTDAAGEEE